MVAGRGGEAQAGQCYLIEEIMFIHVVPEKEEAYLQGVHFYLSQFLHLCRIAPSRLSFRKGNEAILDKPPIFMHRGQVVEDIDA